MEIKTNQSWNLQMWQDGLAGAHVIIQEEHADNEALKPCVCIPIEDVDKVILGLQEIQAMTKTKLKNEKFLKSIDLTPSLEGYKRILKVFKEQKNPTKTQRAELENLEAYIDQEEQKAVK